MPRATSFTWMDSASSSSNLRSSARNRIRRPPAGNEVTGSPSGPSRLTHALDFTIQGSDVFVRSTPSTGQPPKPHYSRHRSRANGSNFLQFWTFSLLEPFDITPHALFKIHLRCPSKIALGFLRRDDFSAVVPWPRRLVLDLDVAKEFPDCLRHLSHGDRSEAFEVVYLVLSDVFEGFNVAEREVFHVNEVPILRTIAEDCEGLAHEGLPDEDWDYCA